MRYAPHMLAWSHVTMQITILGDCIKELRHTKLAEYAEPLTVTGLVDAMERALERTKWNLRRDRPARALDWFLDVEMLMYNFEESYPKFKELEKLVYAFRHCISSGQYVTFSYGEH